MEISDASVDMCNGIFQFGPLNIDVVEIKCLSLANATSHLLDH
jgi:hypothetical protein